MTVLSRCLVLLAAFPIVLTAPFASAADPLNPGPYRVGVRTEVLVDQNRTCAITGQPRTLVTDIWYPIADDAPTTPVNRFQDFWRNPSGILTGTLVLTKFGGDFADINSRFKNVAVRDTDIREGQYPLLIFSHGNGGFRHQNTFQAEYLASHGYVVAAADHTGNAAATILPNRVVIYDGKTRDPERKDDRPHDVSFLIDRLLSLSETDDSWLSGRLHSDQVGMFGHSFGGYTCCRSVELEPRLKAIMPMTLAISALEPDTLDLDAIPEYVGEVCEVPLFVLLAGKDRTVHDIGNAMSTRYYEQASGPKYLLNFPAAGHYTFTEMLQLNKSFGDGIGDERDKDGNVTFTFSDAARDQQITNQYSVAFFDAWLKNDDAARQFLTAPRYADEVEYQHNR